MGLPQRNAVLTKVSNTAEGGRTPEWDDEGTAPTAEQEGPAKWSGRASAYYREKPRIFEGATVIDRHLIVDSRRPPVDFSVGDLLTFTYKGSERMAKITERGELEIDDAAVDGTVRLPLEAG